LRDGLGIPVPPGVAASFTESVANPVADLELPGELGRDRQYCHAKVLSLIKRRTLALLRKGVEPVEQVAYARFLAEWQGIGSSARGADAVLGVIEQLSGYPLPASAVESLVLPARVAGYTASLLDELTAAGEVFWIGDGGLGESDGWLRWYAAGAEPHPPGPEPAGYRCQELLAALAGGGAYFFDALLPPGLAPTDRAQYVDALWDLVWAGLVTGDTFAPVRSRVSGGAHRAVRRPVARTHRTRLAGGGFGRPVRPRITSPTTAGRWSLVNRGSVAPADRLAAELFAQLDRYGVVTRGSVLTENSEGGFGAAYRALTALEESGQCRRGYFVEGLGAAQFALTGAVDRLRAHQRTPEQPSALVLAACDPANPYGAGLPWPEREGHRPGRKAGALVVTVDGALAFYVERGGKTLLSFTEDPQQLAPAAAALAGAVQQGHLGKLTVERADGAHVFGSAHVSAALQEAGFRMTPQGLRLRPAV
jgi:ATP-dependent Lhr-like helicase